MGRREGPNNWKTALLLTLTLIAGVSTGFDARLVLLIVPYSDSQWNPAGEPVRYL